MTYLQRSELDLEGSQIMFIKDLNSAQEAWEALKAHYNPSGFTSQFLVCREFFNT
jgi:hypothetical protein